MTNFHEGEATEVEVTDVAPEEAEAVVEEVSADATADAPAEEAAA